MEKTNKVIRELKKDNAKLNQKVKSLEDNMTGVSDQLTEAENKLKEHYQHIQVSPRDEALLITRQRPKGLNVVSYPKFSKKSQNILPHLFAVTLEVNLKEKWMQF